MARTNQRRGGGGNSRSELPQEVPVQPVEQPILCSPYEEPQLHWHYDR